MSVSRYTWVSLLYDNPMDVVASTIRAGITAPPGKRLVVCDLSSIEYRVLGWISGCQRINAVVEQGLDPYKDFATDMFHTSYDKVTKEQRTIAKPPVLGCGYQLSASGLVRYADSLGVPMVGKEATHAVRTYRTSCWEVAQMWEDLNSACKQCVQFENPYTGYAVTITRDGQFLIIRLPSGRPLHYHQPQVLPRIVTLLDAETGEERKWEVMSLTYMGQNSENHQWQRLSTHGGKITENIVQAIARDVLAKGLQAAEHDPLLEIIGHVHDEIICLADEVNAETALIRLTEHMNKPVKWAPGLKLEATGYVAKRYRKE